MDDIIQPLRPTGEGWIGGNDIRAHLGSPYPTIQWLHEKHGLGVFSAVEVAKDADGIDRGPEYHISISKPTPNGVTRCSAAEAAWVLAQFGVDGAEEDNHVPNGKVRNFWRPVADRFVGMECACKETEHLVIEGDYEHRPLPLTALRQRGR